jgi:Fe-S-cluster containining protein
MSGPATRYRTLLESLDAWTAAARNRHPEVIPCRTGCTACCHGPFDISVADMLLLRETVAALPAKVRERVARRAELAAGRQLALAPEWDAPHDIGALGEDGFDAICERLAGDPCPCLEEGACAVYAGRPAICRMMGLGIATVDGRVLANGCPIQDQFPAYAALPPQPFDLAAFEEKEEACLVEAGLLVFGSAGAARHETTIALALHPAAE